MTLIVKSCSAVAAPVDGGRVFALTGIYPVGVPMTVTFVDGSETRPCYSGLPGQGNTVYAMGGIVSAILPPLPTRAPGFKWTVRVERTDTHEVGELPGGIEAVEPFFCSQTYELRSSYAPIDATGPRSLGEEKFPWLP